MKKSFFHKFDFPVAFIETDYFGGFGEQNARMKKGREVLLPRGEIKMKLVLAAGAVTKIGWITELEYEDQNPKRLPIHQGTWGSGAVMDSTQIILGGILTIRITDRRF